MDTSKEPYSEVSSLTRYTFAYNVVAIKKKNSILNAYYLTNTGFLGGSVVKNPPAKQEMLVRSLGQEDP